MCGIAGMINLTCEAEIREAMLRSMARRGPDAGGYYQEGACTLLHRRLAIVDPAGGSQPMTLSHAGENYVMVYNGELYNTAQVKNALMQHGHQFVTRSDTELVLHAYAQWGWECLEKLNGIFGFAVWEQRSRRLFLARDRLGVKPLFYAVLPQGLIFASEIKTILAGKICRPRLDPAGAAQLILLGPGRIPGSGVLKDILELQPGHYAIYEDKKLSVRRYWYLRDRVHEESFSQTAEHVRDLVTDAIEKQMVCDVPMGTFLSGGLDSSLISSVCARKCAGQLNTFSVDYQDNHLYFQAGGFQPSSDSQYIKRMVEYLNSNHHWTVLTPKELSDTLEQATVARDLPGMADVDFSLLAFCKQIRGHVKMALSGECADELFGGYPWYRDPQIRSAEGFPWSQNASYRKRFLSADLFAGFSGEDYIHELYQDTISQCDILPETSPLERRMREMMNLNVRWFMQTLLDRKDRMSMYSGLEVRVPFCDYRIAEYLYSVPWDFKDHGGVEKGLLRYAMRDYLPQEVLYRKKSPYPKTWHPEYTRLMKQRLVGLLENKNAKLWHLVDREAASELLQEMMPIPWYGQLMKGPQTIAYLLQIDFWLSHYQIEITDC